VNLKGNLIDEGIIKRSVCVSDQRHETWAVRPISESCDEVDFPPGANEGASDALYTSITFIVRVAILVAELQELVSTTTISRGERLIEVGEQELGRIRVMMSGDFMQLALEGKTEMIEIKIIEVVVEGVFNFLTNFEETEKKERREGSPRDSQVFELRVNLELSKAIRPGTYSWGGSTYRKEEEVEPERHPQVSLISEG